MQTANVPTGARNPNGYTEDEILRAIRGVDGTRELTFRYELLDKDMNYKRDLDNVLGGSIQMHYISEIKRTADLTIRDQGDIDWLFDQVKPFIRVKMPSRTYQDGILLNNLWFNDFGGADGTTLTPENSVNHGDAVQSTAGTVRYATGWSAIGASTCLLGTDNGMGGPSGTFGSGRIAFNYRARTSWKISTRFFIWSQGNFTLWPTGLFEDEFARVQIQDSTFLGASYQLGSLDISSLAPNLIEQVVRLEAVNDGHRCRWSLWWTDLDSDTPDWTATEDSSEWPAIQVCFMSGGGFSSFPTRVGPLTFAVPGDTEVIPRIQPVWQNTFNGDADVVVDNDSLRYFGNTPSDIDGYLSFNENWSARGESSLQLGEEGLGHGSLVATVPHRSEWSLSFFANIPEGGKLFIAPSSEDTVPSPEVPQPWPGPVTMLGTNGQSGTWGLSSVVERPSSSAQGDYLLSAVTSNGAGSLTIPEGWDLLDQSEFGQHTRIWVMGKRMGPDEPEHYEFAFDQEHWHSAFVSAVRNTTGTVQIGINSAEDANSMDTPSLPCTPGDALGIIGFDWQEATKSWDGPSPLDVVLDQGRGMIVGARNLPSQTETPVYTLNTSYPDPTRMAAVSVVFGQIPQAPAPYRGVNWIVLDDDSGEYSITGVDVSGFVDQLFGTPIRIEMESDGTDFFWRVYSTNPFGNAPDLNWYGSSSDWGPMRAILFQGGNGSVEPTLIDEVVIGRMVPVDRETPPETNFVEFPMGVFLMTSPERESDDDDVVTREIECYDRTKLFIDDKLTEPFAIKKGELYVPIISDLLGDVPKIVDPGDAVCGRDREFSIGTSKKEVIDRIAEGINYHTLRFDEEGRAVVQRYVNPTNRAPEYNYYDDDISIMYPDVAVEFDAFDIANVFIVSSSEGDGPPIYAKLENHDPANPFSIPRRGRRIVDFREEEEATDRNALLRKVKRLQFEANRLYENVSFNTLINPLHSANDCYNIKYGPLGVDEKYTEINWEIPLEAGSTMTHTARRVVKLDAEADEGFIEDHLEVVGSLTAGNIKWGIAQIPWGTESSNYPLNTPVSITVSGLALKGSGPVQVFVTPVSTAVGSSVRQITTSAESPDGFQIWGVRRTSFDTNVHWLAMRSL